MLSDISVSEGSVATYARCGGIFNIRLTANLLWKLPVKNFPNRLRFDGIAVVSLLSRFYGPNSAYECKLAAYPDGVVGCINEVTLRRARLVLGLVTVFWRVYRLGMLQAN